MIPYKSFALVLAAFSGTLLVAPGQASEAGFIAATPDTLKWTAAPSVGPGAMIAVIEGDLKAAEPFTFRLKLPANLTIGVHTHPTVERVTVLAGVFYFATGDELNSAQVKAYHPGDTLIIPAGVPMFAATREGEAVLQLHGTGPWGISYLDPAQDPRNQ